MAVLTRPPNLVESGGLPSCLYRHGAHFRARPIRVAMANSSKNRANVRRARKKLLTVQWSSLVNTAENSLRAQSRRRGTPPWRQLRSLLRVPPPCRRLPDEFALAIVRKFVLCVRERECVRWCGRLAPCWITPCARQSHERMRMSRRESQRE